MYLLVPDGTSKQFVALLLVAFVLKLIHLSHLIFYQVHKLYNAIRQDILTFSQKLTSSQLVSYMESNRKLTKSELKINL